MNKNNNYQIKSMNKTTKIIGGIIIILIIVLLVIFYKPGPKETIKIGVILPLTGKAAQIIEDMRDSLTLALEEINKDRAENQMKKIELVYEDEKCDPKEAVTAYNALTKIKGVKLIIGPACSPSTLAVGPLAQKEKIVLITPASSADKISELGDYIFRNQVLASYKYSYLGEFVAKRYSTAATIYDISNDASITGEKAFVETFQNLDGQILTREAFGKDDLDFKTQILKIKNLNPEAIFFFALAPQSVQLVRQIREWGIDNLLFTEEATGTDPDLLKLEYSDGIIFTATLFNRETSPEYWDKFVSRFNKNPNVYAAQSYEVLYVFDYALRKCGDKVNTICIKNEIYKLKDFSGATGKINFDENGDVIKSLTIMVIKNGTFVPYEE